MAEIVEDQVDAELHRLENLDEDDLEGIRQRRLAAMKKQQQKVSEWQVSPVTIIDLSRSSNRVR